MMKTIYVLFICLFLTACFGGRSQTAHFYRLQPINPTKTNIVYTNTMAVMPVQLPKSLDRPQMVLSEDEEIIISEKNRWVEPLSNLIERTLTLDLSAVLPRAVVKQKTLSHEKFEAFLTLDVVELRTELGDKMTLNGWWILRSDKGKMMKREKVQVSTEIGDDYSDMSVALSQLLFKISEQISQKI